MISRNKWHIISVFFIVICILLSYSNSFHNSWNFDDITNITEKQSVRIDSFSLSSLRNILMKSTNSRRFISNLSFAVNYYFHEYDVFGYHVVNTLIHVLTSIVLYLFIYLTFSGTYLKEKYGKHAYIIASCASLIFAVHPVHTQAVTYIVQRMSGMAALFYMSSMLFYVKGKLSDGKAGLFFFALSITAALLAFGTKENTIMLPLMIFLYELYFFRKFKLSKAKKILLMALALTAVPLIGAMMIFGTEHLSSLLAGYKFRDFTMMERLLTQPMVVLYYISLLILPLPSRLNLDYDFPVSHSLFDPTATFISICILSGLVLFSVIRAKKFPLLSYFILWYFINLLIESSIFPLEIAYEHRLYIPSIGFIVLAVVSGINGLHYISSKVKTESPYLKHAGICIFIILILLLSAGTYKRNLVWKNAYTLWSDVVQKSPNKARPRNYLGLAYFEKGLLDEAIIQYKECLSIDPSFANAHNNMGRAYFDKGLVDQAITDFQNAIRIKPSHADAHYNLGVAYGEKGLINQAFREMRLGQKLMSER